ncbi:hypothetical protein K1T71_009128 [Dendrolimus kikuchii]|uniref:Uncharacterized protein n=1 Tax=Dendrolimus kikuchii TaxID=765133 RepID=A0ACC1CUQ8_9NEOP|nr:hypothetical protein K1T71_009128 [Dendrolimus kikuchii]
MNRLCIVVLFLFEATWSSASLNQLSDAYNYNGRDKINVQSKRSISPHEFGGFRPTRRRPCDAFNFPKPTFTGRISEIKCQEFIWDMEYEAELNFYNKRCKGHSGYSIPNRVKREEHNEQKDQEEDKEHKDHEEHKEHKDHEEPKQSEEHEHNDKDKNNYPELGVIGGNITIPGEYPHMGAIGWMTNDNSNWKFSCGGSLISRNFVLTAAHCTYAADTSLADPTPKIVRFMARNLTGDLAYDIGILQIIKHPKYASPSIYYDISLLKLMEDVIFNKYALPACLWTKPDLSDIGSGVVSGWGAVNKKYEQSSDLRAAKLSNIDENLCNRLLSDYCGNTWCGIADHQFCAGELAGGVDACRGDSGCPLQIKMPMPEKLRRNMYYVFGVTSFGFGCAEPGIPGIYTRVSSFLDWIEPIVWS